jgi:hypothetical protein
VFGYATWCFAQGVFDTDTDGSDWKGITVRVGNVFSGLGYAALGVFALQRFLGRRMHRHSARYWTTELLSDRWGVWLIGFVGVVLIGAGIAQLVYGQREGFRKYLSNVGGGFSDRRWIVELGKYARQPSPTLHWVPPSRLFSDHGSGARGRRAFPTR